VDAQFSLIFPRSFLFWIFLRGCHSPSGPACLLVNVSTAPPANSPRQLLLPIDAVPRLSNKFARILRPKRAPSFPPRRHCKSFYVSPETSTRASQLSTLLLTPQQRSHCRSQDLFFTQFIPVDFVHSLPRQPDRLQPLFCPQLPTGFTFFPVVKM